MNIGPYILEHDSEIIAKDKADKYRVTVVFSGETELEMTVDMWIEHDSSKSYEEWNIKGDYNIDDAYKLGKAAGMKPTITNKHNLFAASLSGIGKSGKKLYLAAEKMFKRINKTGDSEVYL